MLLYGASSPADTWIDNGDGTATHTLTGLMWMRSALGQAWTGASSSDLPKFYWGTDVDKIVHHFSGHGDWRVPTINELMSIVDLGVDGSCINKQIFPNNGNGTYLSRSGYCVNFGSGLIGIGSFGSLRLVRSLSPALSLEENTKFHDNGDGTATDVSTGLTWMRCALGQSWDGSKGVGEPYSLAYEEALSIRHTFAGSDDWRLPSIGELNSIVGRINKTHGTDRDIFANRVAGSRYLSSTTKGWHPPYCIDFADGAIHFHSISVGIIRLVRGECQSSSSMREKPPIFMGDNEINSHHAAGSLVTLSATPETRPQFMGGAGDAEGLDATVEEAIASLPDRAAMLLRIEVLEAALSEALRKLDALQAASPAPAAAPTEIPARANAPAETQTLPDILAWLATQERVSLAVLRRHLLPLDLLPSAVISEINEQALDLVGDVAFEEVGEEIVIAREVLFEVLANQE
jgi:hypothetical protein